MTNKTLLLKDFEHNINPATWLAADDLLQNGCVKALREVEKHFWVGTVEDGEASYETEAIITPHKIKAFACECFTEGRRLMCPHIAASLVKVRQFLAHRSAERQAQKTAAAAAAAAEPSRLTVRDALENVPPEALEEFVREYARRDRDFALALKTYFAGTVTESENPYALVLESALPKNLPSKPLRDPDFRRFRKTLDDLEMQMNDAIAQHHHRTVFQLASAILLKTNPLLATLEEAKRNQILPNIRTAFQKLMELHAVSASPELRDAALEVAFELGEKGLLPPELLREGVQFLSNTAMEEGQFARIRALFDQTPHPAPAFVLYLFLAALSVRRMPQAVTRVLEDYAAQPETLRDAILQLYYLNHWESVTAAGEYFLKKGPLEVSFTAQQRREIEDVLLFIAEKTGDRERQITYLRERFRQGSSLDAFTRLKALFQAEWPAELLRLVTELRESGDRTRLAVILAAEGEMESLAALLTESDNFSLLQRYEAQLLAWDKHFVRDQYLTYLSGYLRDHFGPPASAQVRIYLNSLLHRGEPDVVSEIIRSLAPLFPDRPTLPAELAELFPKNRQKAILLPPMVALSIPGPLTKEKMAVEEEMTVHTP